MIGKTRPTPPQQVTDRSLVWNTDLIETLELDNLLTCAGGCRAQGLGSVFMLGVGFSGLVAGASLRVLELDDLLTCAGGCRFQGLESAFLQGVGFSRVLADASLRVLELDNLLTCAGGCRVYGGLRFRVWNA